MTTAKLSYRARLARWILFRRKALEKRLRGNIPAQRRSLEAACNLFPKPRGVRRSECGVAGIPCERYEPAVESQGVFFYVHGGGYVIGSPRAFAHLSTRICQQADMTGYAVDYRLAPEHPFPAAVDDAFTAFEALASEYGTENMTIGGDSAGGGIALAVMLRRAKLGLPMPRKAWLLSPLTDQTASSGSFLGNDAIDPILAPDWLADDCAPSYLPDGNLHEPEASPLFGDPTGLPPMLIQVGTEEILLDDSVQFAMKAKNAGCKVELEIGDGLWHDWPVFAPWVPESNQALARAAAFLKAR